MKANGPEHVRRLTSVPPLHEDSQLSFLLEQELREDLIEVGSVKTEVNTLAFVEVSGMSWLMEDQLAGSFIKWGK